MPLGSVQGVHALGPQSQGRVQVVVGVPSPHSARQSHSLYLWLFPLGLNDEKGDVQTYLNATS